MQQLLLKTLGNTMKLPLIASYQLNSFSQMQFSIFRSADLYNCQHFQVQASAVVCIKRSFLNYLYVLSLIMNFQPYLARNLRYISNENDKCSGRGEERDVKASRQKLRPCPLLRVPTSCHPITSTKTTTNSYR